MGKSRLDLAINQAFGHEGPNSWLFGMDFIDATWFTKFPVITETGDASAPLASDINVEEANGILKITTGSGDNEDLCFQLDAEFVKLEANKYYWGVCKVNTVTHATDTGYAFGLGAYDNVTDMLAGSKIIDGVFFQTLGDGTDIDFVTEKASSQVVDAGSGTAVADTFFKLGWTIQMSTAAGTGTVTAYVDDVVKYGPTEISTLPTEVMGPFMYVENESSAGAVVVEVDHFYIGGER